MEDKKNSNSGIIIMLVLVVGVLVGMGGYYVYSNIMTKNKVTNVYTDTKKTNSVGSSTVLDTKSAFVNNLISRLQDPVSTCDPSVEYYSKETVTPSDLGSDMIKRIAIKNSIPNSSVTNCQVTNSLVNYNAKRIFGDNTNISSASITGIRLLGTNFVAEYKATDDSYYVYQGNSIQASCAGGYIVSKIIDAVKTGNTVVVTISAAKVAGNSTDSQTITNIVDNTTFKATNFNIETDYAKVYSYAFTFRYNDTYNDYYLEKVTHAK